MSNPNFSLYQKRLQESLKRKKNLDIQRYSVLQTVNTKKDYRNPQKHKNTEPRTQTDIVILIPVWGRHKVLRSVIASLKQQTMEATILCVVSNIQDGRFCKSLGADICHCPNSPLGRKFQSGVYEAKKYNPKALMILGSDDMLSYTYIEKTFKNIKKGYDFIGKNIWYIFSPPSETFLAKYVQKHAHRYLGAGRTYSRRFLDKVGWRIFDPSKSAGLDHLGERLAKNKNMKRLALGDNTYVFSMKGNWSMLHSLRDMKKSPDMMSLSRLKSDRSKYMLKGHLKNCWNATGSKSSKKPIKKKVSNKKAKIDSLKALTAKISKTSINGDNINGNDTGIAVDSESRSTDSPTSSITAEVTEETEDGEISDPPIS
jgi:glycosyltransferase involved in cell wall biosynthesis